MKRTPSKSPSRHSKSSTSARSRPASSGAPKHRGSKTGKPAHKSHSHAGKPEKHYRKAPDTTENTSYKGKKFVRAGESSGRAERPARPGQKSRPSRSEHSNRSSHPRGDKPQSGRPQTDRRPAHTPEAPQSMAVIITALDTDGTLYGLPEDRDLVGLYPRLRLVFAPNNPLSAAQVGDVVLVNEPTQEDATNFSATVIGKPQKEKPTPDFLGEFQEHGGFAFVRSMLKELNSLTFSVPSLPKPAPNAGDVVRVKAGKKPYKGATPVTIIENLGPNPKGLASMLAIENFGIRTEWPEEVTAYTTALPSTLTEEMLNGREDLRALPLVTIDGADARDFDDAVWAEKTKDGHHIIVAIADVAYYVAEGSALDKEAKKRGNSTYFPDAVVPMLPERLSNDLCSLRPNEDRPVMAVHLYIDDNGRLTKYTFTRAVIHSHARLTYEQAQTALNSQKGNEREAKGTKRELNRDKGTETAQKVLISTLVPLYNAYKVLLSARKKRHSIDLDIPESQLVIAPDGTVEAITVRERLDTHKLIEEMMILANVAAAKALGSKGAPCLYRIHPEPDGKKMDTLKAILQPHGVSFKSQSPSQKDYQELVERVTGHPAQATLMKSILQSQMQAKYDTDNLGHFGLSLTHYAHFTSPIRRYADLIVHRSLIAELTLPGEGALVSSQQTIQNLASTINEAERRSQKAEWEARDRLMTQFYSQYIGSKFQATVISVLKFGCFMSIGDGVAEGLLPMRKMQDDHYIFDEKTQSLFGKKTHRKIKVGDILEVMLIEADRVEGRLTFQIQRPARR